jgi:hypothetical protein
MNLINNASIAEHADLKMQMIGKIESLMTRHANEGDYHFVQLLLADGRTLRAKWRAEPGDSLPNLGTVLRLEVVPPIMPAIGLGAEKTCHQVKSWQVIQIPYPTTDIDGLYQTTEHPQALDRLWAIISRITVPCLRTWLFNVFTKPQLAIPFVQVPASHQHHHSYPGGLLLHSVECAEWVERVAMDTLNDKEIALTTATALLHDMGKIETLRHTDVGRMVDHQVLSLILMEPLLRDLQTQWPQGAHALRQMLSWSPQSGKFPKFPGVLLVKMADQYSAALSARNMAFAGQPDFFYWATLKTPTSIQHFNRVV